MSLEIQDVVLLELAPLPDLAVLRSCHLALSIELHEDMQKAVCRISEHAELHAIDDSWVLQLDVHLHLLLDGRQFFLPALPLLLHESPETLEDTLDT